MSIMGVGTNSLGYSDPFVDSKVIEVVKKGNLSTLNCFEEIELAERLVQINPWAEMVRFTRAGGEANAMMARICRAASGKSKIAVCGYHGWHDWYLALNLEGRDDLKDHLLPGLSSVGVPEGLSGSVVPFNYNDYSRLEEIVLDEEVGTIYMEVERSSPPKDDFLQKVRALCNRKGIILAFDECTSGFRECFGGIFNKHKVNPDICVFGKALGNGYAINAVVGTKNVMDNGQSTFMSSTFWTERIGPTAALATLKRMEETKSWETISLNGEMISSTIQQLANTHSVKVEISGLKPIIIWKILSNTPKKELKYKTYLTQEMLKSNILASGLIYTSIHHSNEVTQRFFHCLDQIFKTISSCEQEDLNIDNLLETDVAHTTFTRLI